MTAGYVSPTTQPAGSAVPTTRLNAYKAGLDALVGKPVGFWYQNGGIQAIPTSTTAFTVLTYDTEAYDTQSGLVPTSGVYTAQAGWAGYYRVSGVYWMVGSASGSRYAVVQVNGTPVPGTICGDAAPNAGQRSLSCTGVVFLNATDTCSIAVQQSSGASLNTVIGTNIGSSMSIEWLRS